MADSSFLPPNLPPRLLDRRASAAYVGLSATKFDELVCDGRMPKPKKIDRRRAWDIRALDSAIDALPGGEDAEQNPFDD
jgi:predicted DNA-binding transcriptional regulator AlpA